MSLLQTQNDNSGYKIQIARFMSTVKQIDVLIGSNDWIVWQILDFTNNIKYLERKYVHNFSVCGRIAAKNSNCFWQSACVWN